MTRDRLVPVDVDRLSVRSNFVTNVNAVVPVQIAILDSNVEIRKPRRRLDMVFGGAVDRLSAMSKLATSMAGALGGENAIHGGGALWSSLRWHGGVLLRTRSSWWRPIFVEVAVGARIIHEDIHQDG